MHRISIIDAKHEAVRFRCLRRLRHLGCSRLCVRERAPSENKSLMNALVKKRLPLCYPYGQRIRHCVARDYHGIYSARLRMA